MAKYQTPGIYTEEIPIFPPKIEKGITTAVFIGYTEKHESESGENLLNIPTKINSILEFEMLFGKAQIEENIEIIDNSVDDNADIFVQFNGNQSLHNLYYSLVSFFDNGGNFCKIVSVGLFKNIGESLSADELIAGLNSLIDEEENLLISVPEDQNLEEEEFYLVQKEILKYCKTFRGFAILNVPKTTKDNFHHIIEDYRTKTQTHPTDLSFGAAYIPNLVTNQTYLFQEDSVTVIKNGEEFSLSSFKDSDAILYLQYLHFIQKFSVILSPTGTVSGGVIASEDRRGIWKTPANFPLSNILKPIFNISKAKHDLLNVDVNGGKSINAIRAFSGRGTVIFGGRTLNGNASEWKYISVRRFASLLESDIQKGLKRFIFEPNDSITWNKITSTIDNYLNLYWREGALAGAKPEHAYFVRCGKNTTMTDLDILENRISVQIGIAPIRPAEFIIFELKQKLSAD